MSKLATIAEKTGVSPATVLRILRGDNKEVWPSAVRRAAEVRSLAMKLGYMPNASARATRRGKANAVALLLSTNQGRSNLPSELLNQIHDSLDTHRLRLLVSKLADETLTDRQALPSILREWACDGLLINYTDHIPEKMIELIRNYRVPSVWMNSRQESDCVYYDDFGGALEATRHLIELSHRKIAYLDFTVHEAAGRTHYSRVDRFAGYLQAMRSSGLKAFDRDRVAGAPVRDRLQATIDLLKSPDRPTAIVTYDAAERLLYAAAMAGLRVPQDLSIVSFGHRAVSGELGEMFFGRAVTSMRIPAEKAGKSAVEMVLKKIAAPQAALPSRVIPLDFQIGDTTGPCGTV